MATRTLHRRSTVKSAPVQMTPYVSFKDAAAAIAFYVKGFGALSAQTLGACPIVLHLFVADVDAFVARAIASGATLLRPVTDEFYGDRAGQIADPFGYKWMIATRKKQVALEEMQRLWTQALAGS